METTIFILSAALVFCIIYIRILKKENKILITEILECEKLIPQIKETLNLQKNLAKTFEAGYDYLKNKN